MGRSIIILLIVVFSYATKAFPAFSVHAMYWNKGVIVLNDRKVITGEVCYQYEFGRVFVKEGTKIISFPTKTVSSVRFYDQTINVNRCFIQLEHVNYSSEPEVTNALFEVVVNGDLQVLRTPKKYMGVPNGMEDVVQSQKNYDYYLNAFGELIKLSEFKAILLPKLYERIGHSVRQMIAENKLNLNNKGDCIRLIVLCNQANAASGVVLTSL